MADFDVLEPQVLELHGGQLQDQPRLAVSILVADLADFPLDEGAHLDRMEA